jgi:hypothetical protein
MKEQELLTGIHKEIFEKAYEMGYRDGHFDGESARMKIMELDKTDQAEKIVDICCTYLNIEYSKLRSQSRQRELVYARQICMSMLCVFTRLTLKDIGKMFNGRDHTTVCHSRDLIATLRGTDEEVNNDFEYLSDAIRRCCLGKEEVEIQVKTTTIKKQTWSDYYKGYKEKKRIAEKKIIRSVVVPEEEEVRTPIIRHAAEYSNGGHINLIKKLSKATG